MSLTKRIKQFIHKNGWDIFLFSIVVLVGIIVFGKSFSYGLFGDDWHHYYFIMYCKKLGSPCLNFILHPYGGETAFMNIVAALFKYNSTPYYIASFILRSFATLTLYVLVKLITKKRLYAFIASLFFILSLGGIQTTDWVHYANIYLALALLNLGVFYLFKYQSDSNKFYSKYLISYFLFFALSIMVSPVRLHGLLFLYPVSEILLVIIKNTTLKKSIARIGIFILIVFFIKQVGFFGNTAAQTAFVEGTISYMSESYKNAIEVFLYPFGSFANMLFPNGAFGDFIENRMYLFVISPKQYIFLMLPVALFNYLLSITSRIKSKLYLLPIAGWAIFLVFLKIVFTDNLGGIGREVLVGGMSVFFVFSLLIHLIVNQKLKLAYTLLFFLSWPFAFIFVPHLFSASTVMTTEARYLNIPTQGAIILFIFGLYILDTIVLSDLAAKFSGKKNKRLLLVGNAIFIATSFYLIYVNAVGVYNYFEKTEYRRNSEVVDYVFGKTVDIIEEHKIKDYFMVIFDYDDSAFWHNTVYFGGSFRYVVEKDIIERSKTPDFIGIGDLENEFAERSYIENKYGRPLPELENIIGIRVQKSGEVYDITEEIKHLISDNLSISI